MESYKYKIVVAIKDPLLRRIYKAVFLENGFEVLLAENNQEVLELAKNENPNIILIDALFDDGFKMVEALKKDLKTQKIPVVIFSQFEREGDKERAMELEAKDFVVGSFLTPRQVVLKMKIHLGEQKTYRIKIDKNLKEIQELARDLGYKSLNCPFCGSTLEIFLIRDLSRGENYFKLSFICPKCLK